MHTLRGRWLHASCRCGHITPHRIALLLGEQPALANRSLADALVNLRCHGCRQRGQLTVHLCEKAAGPAPGNRDLAGWVLLLHGAQIASQAASQVAGEAGAKQGGEAGSEAGATWGRPGARDERR